MKIAFFDFDGTITKHDTFIEFAKFCLGRKKLVKAILKNIVWIILWKMGVILNSDAKHRLFRTLYKGKSYDWFKQCCINFKEIINKDLNLDILRILELHKEEGHTVVIVSASIKEWIFPWAKENGVNHVIATEIEIDNNGILTGNFITPNCYGIEKVNRLSKLFPNVYDYETWGYGDSKGDEQMLNIVTHKYS